MYISSMDKLRIHNVVIYRGGRWAGEGGGEKVRNEKVGCGQRGRGAELTIIIGSRRWTRS